MKVVKIKTLLHIPDKYWDEYLEYLKSYLPEKLVSELKKKGECRFTALEDGLEKKTEYRVFDK